MDLPTTALRALPAFAAVAFTPVAVALWSKLFPPSKLGVLENLGELHLRNSWIDAVACFVCGAGFVLPIVLFWSEIDSVGWPSIGLAFGAGIVLPCIWICIATLPFGLSRYRGFWRFYEQRYRIGMTGIMIIYVPFALLGLVSALELVRRGIW
jgi:hypothetical protein